MVVVCGLGFLVLNVLFIGLTAAQLPGWTQGPIIAWMMNVPQETYETDDASGAPGTPYNGGQVPYDPYVGPTSFLCILPPEIGYLSDPYGVPRGEYTHSGIDYGTYYRPVPVRTPIGGKVIYAGWSPVGYGMLVVIANEETVVYLAHNSQILVGVGQIVQAGEVIGLSGSTGNSDGVHVHFEVRYWNGTNWTPVNPENILLPGQVEFCDWDALAVPEPPTEVPVTP